MFYLIYDKPGEPCVYLGTLEDVNGDLNSLLPNAQSIVIAEYEP